MKKRRRSNHTPLAYRAEEALKKAVAEAIAEHRRNGVPIAIWRNGKVIRIPTDQIEVREPQIEYEVSLKKRKYYLQSPTRIKGAQKKGWEQSIAISG